MIDTALVHGTEGVERWRGEPALESALRASQDVYVIGEHEGHEGALVLLDARDEILAVNEGRARHWQANTTPRDTARTSRRLPRRARTHRPWSW